MRLLRRALRLRRILQSLETIRTLIAGVELSSRLVADIIEVVVRESITQATDWWKAEVWSILVITMIIWIVVVDWSSSLVAASSAMRTVEFAVMSLTRISRHPIV